jgi:hypothetical protein
MAQLNPNMVTAQPLQISGATFENYEVISCKDVYVPTDSSEMNNNPTRVELLLSHVSALALSIDKGIDYNQRPPMVVRCNNLYNGKRYHWRLIAGFHRAAAFQNLNIKRWIYAVYSPMPLMVEYKLNLMENDHAPQLMHSKLGIANTLQALHEQGLPNTDEAFTAALEEMLPNIGKPMKREATNEALKQTGGVIDYKTWTTTEIKHFLKNDANGYEFGGGLVQNPEGDYVHSFTLGEGKEERMIWNSLKRNANDNHESEFIGHTKTPSNGETANDRRKGVANKLDELHEVLEHAYNYRKENGRWPYKLKAFLPQDNKAKEKELIFVA